jgi:alkylation response protein AidB-like acyl-CoA dehydrogenase
VQFSFSEQQRELRAAVRLVLERECTPGDLRALAEGRTGGRSAERWSVLGELGATSLLVGEDSGGLGLDEVDLIGVLEESGWAALPEPLSDSALAAALLEDLNEGSNPRVKDWLSGLATGELVGAVGGIGVGTELVANSTDEDRGVLTPFVPASVDFGLFAINRSPDSTETSWEIHGVGADAMTFTPTPTLDATRRIGMASWAPSHDTLLVQGSGAAQLVEDCASRAATFSAAQLVGLADRMISMTAEYARHRQQFAKPIGSFQAVKHHLANARVKLEFARPATYRAAHSIANKVPSRHHDASMAKALASDAGDLAARVSLQIHGAIGYTWECDLQLFLKRAWSLSASWGSAPVHRSRVLRSVLEEISH